MIKFKYFSFWCLLLVKFYNVSGLDAFEIKCNDSKHGGCWQSPLCARKPKQNVDCTSQLLGESAQLHPGQCSVVYYQTNSTICHDKEFLDVGENNAELGDIKLKPHFCHYCTLSEFAALNVTMSNIQWNNLAFRFKADKDKLKKNHCRDIAITPSMQLPNSSTLYYNCLWTGSQDLYAGVIYTFQYHASKGNDVMNGKYIFKVPYASLVDGSEVELSKWKPFTYVEIKKYQLVLHIVEAPEKFNVTGYRILAFREDLDNRDISTTLVNVTEEFESDEVTYEIKTNMADGVYYFTVTALSENCTNHLCNTVQTPKVTVAYNTKMYICIASVAAVVCAIVACGFIFLKRFYIRSRDKNLGSFIPQKDEEEDKRPILLINYTRVSQKHFKTVQNFVNCLQSYDLTVSYDEDIDNTDFRDPIYWCKSVIANADFYINVLSPQDKPAETFGVYRNVDVLLKQSFENEYAITNMPRINVIFEYDVGIKSKNKFRKANDFYLPKDWKLMMNYICKRGKVTLDLKVTESRKKLLDGLLLSTKQY